MKKCCYMDRKCDKDCVAYVETQNPLIEGLTEAGMPEIACFRLFMELTQVLPHPFEDEDEDWDEDDEDEDWDEKE
ncbi:MAG: hypothetical protein QME81_17035 [bacterium]|nr:hypothetical protein [bacterium]